MAKSSLSIWHLLWHNDKLAVKILSIFVAFLENMNFKEEHVYHTKCNFKIRNSRNIYLVNWFKYKYFELIKHEFFPLNVFLLKTQINSLKTQQKDKLYSLQGYIVLLLKFMFSKKATIIDKIFTADLTLCHSKCQIDTEDFANFCGLLRKHELYVVHTRPKGQFIS